MIPTPVKIVPFRRPSALLLFAVGLALLPRLASAQRSAPTPEEAYASAVQLYDEQLYADALSAFEAYRDAYPDDLLNGQALYLEAKSALAQNRDAVATRLFEELQRTYASHPRAPEAQLSLAQYFLEDDKPQAAREQLTAIVNDPSSSDQAARALYLLGQNETERGNVERALTYFQRVKAEHPQADVAPASFYAVGATQVRLEEYDEAAAAFEDLGQQFPDSPYSQNLGTALAEVYYRLEEYDETARELEERLPQLEGSQRARALFLLAESYNQLREGEDAVVHYRRVIDEHPNTPYAAPARFGLAWHYHRGGDHQEAAESFARVRRNHSDALAERATYYEAVNRTLLGEADEAISLFERVTQQQPDSRLAAEALFESGLLRYQQEDYDSAAAFFRSLTREHPQSARADDAYYWLGNAYLAAGDLDRSLEAYTQAAERDAVPDSLLVEARFQKAWAQYEDQRYADAAPEFLSVVESHPNTPRGREALFWGADSFYEQGNFNRARSLFRRYLNEHPDGEHANAARYGLAWTHFKQSQYQSSAQLFRQFLNNYEGLDSEIPYRQDARMRLADSYFALKQYEDAVEIYRQVDGEGRDYALYQAGEALNYAGRREEALQSLRRLDEQYPNSRWHPEALYRLGSIHFQEQEYEQAREAYRQLLNTYPDHARAPEARYGIGDSYYNAGNMEEAVQAYRAVLEEHPTSATANEAALSLFFSFRVAEGEDDAEAEELISSIESATPNTELGDRLRFARAKAAYQSGESDKALDLFRDFVRTSSETSLLPESYYYLGLLYADDDATTEAQNYLQQLVDQYPDSEVQPEGALRLGDLYLDEEAYEEAIDAYDAAAESDAIDDELRAQALYGQSRALLNMNRNEEAKTLLDRILEEERGGPLQASARLGRARIHEDEGQTDEALDLYRTVAEGTDSETGAEALYRLGRLLRTEGQPQDAIQELDRMSSLFAGHPEWVARGLIEQARAYRQMGETGQAAALYEEVTESYSGTEFARTAQKERDEL